MQSFLINAEFVYLQYSPSTERARTVAVLLLDREGDTLLASFTDNVGGLNNDDLQRMAELGIDIAGRSQDKGGAALFEYIVNTYSHLFRISSPQQVVSSNLYSELDRLSEEYLGFQSKQGSEIPNSIPCLSSGWSLLASAFHPDIVRNKVISWMSSWRTLDIAWFAASGASVLLLFFGGIKAVTTNAIHVNSQSTRPYVIAALNIEPPVLNFAQDVAKSPTDGAAETVTLRRSTAERSRAIKVKTPRQFSPPASSSIQVKAPTLISPQSTLNPSPLSFSRHSVGVIQMQVSPPPTVKKPAKFLRVLRALAYPFRQVGYAIAQ